MTDRPYLLERVGPAAVVQLYADAFHTLAPEDRVLAWHLYEAALAGRDIYYDQRYEHGLAMRDVIEALFAGRAHLPADVAQAIERYTKLFWLNSGPYDHITARKFVLGLTRDQFVEAIGAVAAAGIAVPLGGHATADAFVDAYARDFLDEAWRPMVTSKTPGPGEDILASSANNLYVNLTSADVDAFEEQYALNSRLVKDPDGTLREEVYRVGGRYGATIARVVSHLEAARDVAPPPTAIALDALIRFYRTGEEEDRRDYDIAWVTDARSPVDTINGFIEVYLDARGRKGAWEGLVFHEHPEKTRHIRRIAEHAAWFEAHMPYAEAYRRTDVVGVSARAIDVLVECGDAGPMTAIGINLPNDESIREVHGSKSVSLANVVEAYEQSQPESLREEFCWDEAERDRARRFQAFAGELATSLHEVIGHGSGRMAPHVGPPQAVLREQYSTLEETRSDLVALWFIADPVMVELGLIAADDHAEVVRAEYEAYARNALVQLRRVRQGTHLEEDHMRNRQAIVHWLMAHTTAIERRTRDGRTFHVVTDVEAFRAGVGRMLALVQQIKSEGQYEEAVALFEAHGIHFDPALRDEIVARVDRLDLPSYTGFVMPRLAPVRDETGRIVDVEVSYPCDLATQMLEYSKNYRMADVDRARHA
ncbi:dihydrofolate reductase [Luteitalea sp. TBR-22]|uniref:dipeptidyl peptidase 3 n=1 Tax=Luteitalea sp. TBR-22 TaxID=2802971 RepID=UPI001AF811E8|nr:dipeptidyl peptidase 3 [Luteitalea sp. TBR-22]BCS36041.1 dihydrofolate reductase [Luteitalea sp. TBR-22]